jgi:hypothetical protein
MSFIGEDKDVSKPSDIPPLRPFLLELPNVEWWTWWPLILTFPGAKEPTLEPWPAWNCETRCWQTKQRSQGWGNVKSIRYPYFNSYQQPSSNHKNHSQVQAFVLECRIVFITDNRVNSPSDQPPRLRRSFVERSSQLVSLHVHSDQQALTTQRLPHHGTSLVPMTKPGNHRKYLSAERYLQFYCGRYNIQSNLLADI